jgi:hypothetical protein
MNKEARSYHLVLRHSERENKIKYKYVPGIKFDSSVLLINTRLVWQASVKFSTHFSFFFSKKSNKKYSNFFILFISRQ